MTITIEEAARGYVCLDCNNSELFKGMSNLFRLYKPISENFDFNNEIVCPETISCHECSSKNIGIEISPNKIITKHMMSEGSGAWLFGEKWLLDVDETKAFTADFIKSLSFILILPFTYDLSINTIIFLNGLPHFMSE